MAGSSNERVATWTMPIVGTVVAGLLGLWVQNVTTNQNALMKAVAESQAILHAHLDGHPGRVEDRVGDLEASIAELRADVRVILERITPTDTRRHNWTPNQYD